MYRVKWTNRASLKYYQTLHFWNIHNTSMEYSTRIQKEVQKTIALIQRNPNIGRLLQTKKGNVRRIVVLRKFSIHYHLNANTIEIVAFWSNSQQIRF